MNDAVNELMITWAGLWFFSSLLDSTKKSSFLSLQNEEFWPAYLTGPYR